jgi:uncharacterized protein DUF6186
MTRAVTLWGYAVLAGAGVAYQVAGLVLGRTATLEQALDRLRRVRAGRFLLLSGWLWVGWHTFVRSG